MVLTKFLETHTPTSVSETNHPTVSSTLLSAGTWERSEMSMHLPNLQYIPAAKRN